MQRDIRRMLSAAALAVVIAPAHAIVVDEIEGNDTLSTAQRIVTSDTMFTLNAQRTFGDPSDDFFSFQVAPNTRISIFATLSSTGLVANAESVVGLFDPARDLVASAFQSTNAAGQSLGEFSFTATAGGLYTIGFSGFNPGLIACGGSATSCYDTDDDFVPDTFVAGGGVGGSTGWDYAIAVTAVPEPSTLALLLAGLGVISTAARQRRRVA